jgi:hypothetical protein
MKKYLSGLFPVVIALSLSAYKSSENTKVKVFNQIFSLMVTPAQPGLITELDEDQIYYLNWIQTGTELVVCTASAEQRACQIVVDPKYTSNLWGTIVLNAVDPDGMGLKEAFPMTETTGTMVSCVQYYKVNTIDVASQIDVRNGTVQ